MKGNKQKSTSKQRWSGVNLLQSLTLSLTSIRMSSKIFAAFCLFSFYFHSMQRRTAATVVVFVVVIVIVVVVLAAEISF